MILGKGAFKAEVSNKVQLVILSNKDKLAVNKTGRKVIGEKRMKELTKVVKNYERRQKRAVKKYYGEVSWENVNKYRRAMNNRAVQFDFDLSTIKSVKDFNALVKWLEADKTRQFKLEIAQDRRNWLKKMLENGYDMTASEFPDLFAVIDRMSGDDILRWSINNANLVKEIFYHYEDYWDSQSAETWESITGQIQSTIYKQMNIQS